MRYWKLLVGLLALLLVVAACGDDDETGMPNPASVYCGEQGGTADIRTAADGSQQGFCVFDDGSECDEWAFFNGTCAPGDSLEDVGLANPAAVYCEEQGGTVDIRTAADGSQQGFCVFDDGSECDEWAFFNGTCAPGDSLEDVGLANPASAYCEEQGGTSEMREGEDGTTGYCVFDDGSECEEWAFFRGECEPAG
jgi:putative hemolysin